MEETIQCADLGHNLAVRGFEIVGVDIRSSCS